MKLRRQWRKLDIGLDADSGDVIAQTLTDHMASDIISQLQPLLNQIDGPIACLTADVAYDGAPVTQRSVPIVPAPRSSFHRIPIQPRQTFTPPSQRA